MTNDGSGLSNSLLIVVDALAELGRAVIEEIKAAADEATLAQGISSTATGEISGKNPDS